MSTSAQVRLKYSNQAILPRMNSIDNTILRKYDNITVTDIHASMQNWNVNVKACVISTIQGLSGTNSTTFNDFVSFQAFSRCWKIVNNIPRKCKTANLRIFELHLGKCFFIDVDRQFLAECYHAHRPLDEHCAKDRRDHRRRRRWRRQLWCCRRRRWCSFLLTAVLTCQLPPSRYLRTKFRNQVRRQHLDCYLQQIIIIIINIINIKLLVVLLRIYW